MSRDDILRRTSRTLCAGIEDDLLVLDPALGRLYTLSHSAALIYEAVDGLSTVTEIAAELGAEFDVASENISDDVTATIDAMVAQGLLVVDDPSSLAAGLPQLRVQPHGDPDRWANRPATGPVASIGPKLVGARVVLLASSVPEVVTLLREPLSILPAATSTEPIDDVVSVIDPGDSGPYEIRDGQTITTAFSADDAAEEVLAAYNRIATTAPTTAVRIHGGVATSGDQAVVVCGESGAGKSSLTAALTQSGWQYLSDEVAVIDRTTLLVTPYPKWIDLSSASMKLLGLDERAAIGPTGSKHHVPASAFGQVGEQASVRAVVILTGSADEPNDEPRVLQPREAVLAMIGNVFATTWDDPDGLQGLADLCTMATVVQMPRRPLDETVTLVRALVE